MITRSEENYLKTIFSVYMQTQSNVSTNEIANLLETSPASVTEMIKKLQEKNLVIYEKYNGVRLSNDGENKAISIIRKHRLWETFLVNHLKFNWDQVHVIAEQLEHIDSDQLIDKLDHFLDYPKSDPHGDPIPGKNGEIINLGHIPLNDLKIMQTGNIAAVKKGTPSFLQYMDKLGIKLGTKIKIMDKIKFDESLEIKIHNKSINISLEVAKNILIKI